jgi:hypothetical protein
MRFKNYNKKDIKDLFAYLIPSVLVLSMIVLLTCCKSTVQIPVQTIEKVVYKDTVIYLHDSILVEIPFETVKEVTPIMDTSYLKTSVAESVAYVDTMKRKIHHTLTQKGEIKTIHDTIVKFQYIDRIIEREVPVEVEVIKYKRDALFWCLLGWLIFCLLLIGLRLFIIKK